METSRSGNTDPKEQESRLPDGGQQTQISDIYELTSAIVRWRNTVYPDATPMVMLDKLIEEMEELKDRPCDGHEMADIMIIFLDLCGAAGIDIVKVVHWKMLINEGRTWEIDKDGKLQHCEPTESGQRETLAYCTYCSRTNAGGTPVQCLYDVGESCLVDGTGRRFGQRGKDPRLNA